MSVPLATLVESSELLVLRKCVYKKVAFDVDVVVLVEFEI